MLPRKVKNDTVGEFSLAGVETPRWFAIMKITAKPRSMSSSLQRTRAPDRVADPARLALHGRSLNPRFPR